MKIGFSEFKDVTLMLHAARTGEPGATDQLVQLLYNELRDLASRYLRSERREHTLQPTALVHEAYIRLVDDGAQTWKNRAHFFASAARAIRRILVEHARKRSSLKRGGGREIINLPENEIPDQQTDEHLLALDELLNQLGKMDEQRAKIVELRFFGGLTMDEVATVLDISPSTVARGWRVSRAWLRSQMDESKVDESGSLETS